MIGSDEKGFIRAGFEADLRSDGRNCNDSRPLSLSLGDLQQCSGSARCTLGSTDVIVGVKVSIDDSLCVGGHYQSLRQLPRQLCLIAGRAGSTSSRQPRLWRSANYGGMQSLCRASFPGL